MEERDGGQEGGRRGQIGRRRDERQEWQKNGRGREDRNEEERQEWQAGGEARWAGRKRRGRKSGSKHWREGEEKKGRSGELKQ